MGKLWTIQCVNCLRILGVSTKDLQKEGTYCMSCAKENVLENKSFALEENQEGGKHGNKT